MKYTIQIIMNTATEGQISFSDGPIGINCVCWFKETTPIEKGKRYRGAATRMKNKVDSVTGEKRPGIFLKELGAREIFIHEGRDVSWSENCVVLNRDDMMKMWDHVVTQGDQEKYVIEIQVV